MNKVISLDAGYYLHASGFLWLDLGRVITYLNDEDRDLLNMNPQQKTKLIYKTKGDKKLWSNIKQSYPNEVVDYNFIRKNIIPFTYNCFNMMFSDLRKVGIDKEDIIILGKDARNSWRKDYSGTTDVYKSGRSRLLQEMYNEFDWLLEKINKSIPWKVIHCPRTEYDDIGSVASRFYQDKEVIHISADSDLEQLRIYPNTKIFAPKKQYKGKTNKGAYKITPENYNPYAIISTKINKEVSDGLKTSPQDAREFQQREMIITLLTLPDIIEEPIITELQKPITTKLDLTNIPYPSFAKKWDKLYDKSNTRTYEMCVEQELKKKDAKKKVKKEK